MRLDDDTYLDTSHSIGEIKLVIFRTTVPKKIEKRQRASYLALPHLKKVHERSKKENCSSSEVRPSLTLHNA